MHNFIKIQISLKMYFKSESDTLNSVDFALENKVVIQVNVLSDFAPFYLFYFEK